MPKRRTLHFWIITILAIIIVWLNHPMGYLFVLTGPQYAVMSANPVITGGEILLDDQRIPIDNNHWKSELNDPKKLLSGATQILIYQEGISNMYFLSLSFCPTIESTKNNALPIINEAIRLGIDAGKKSDRFISEWSNDAARGKCEGIISTENIPSGEIVIDEYKQSMKHIILKGRIQNLKAKLVGIDEDDITSLTIDSLTFSIDSPVIYEWSNKGGTTWRL